MTDTILLDLDGTLLPMDQGMFTEIYFGALVPRAAEAGIEKRAFMKAMRAGTQAMLENDGRVSNRERFLCAYTAVLPADTAKLEAMFEAFYADGFAAARRSVRPSAQAPRLIQALREKHYGLVLATNPLFPRSAVEARIRWAGLAHDDFDFVTDYENSRYCKPNPGYYTSILARIGRKPSACLMAGNSIPDDMAAEEAGIPVFLVTDCLENDGGDDLSRYPHGTLADLAGIAEGLPALQR
jgi:FMN phosphatase YigB (HAD superfamily)